MHAQQAFQLLQGAPGLSLQALGSPCWACDSISSRADHCSRQFQVAYNLFRGASGCSSLEPHTLGCETAMFSMAIELIHSPPDLMTSLLRSVMFITPNLSRVATSPGSQQTHPQGGGWNFAAVLGTSHHWGSMQCLHHNVRNSRAARAGVVADSKGASMVSQRRAHVVLTSSEPAILVHSRAAIMLQGKPSHQCSWPAASDWPAARAVA